jgi:NADPH-dependent 7-cyano-7-deazaguanine reductase QueF
MFFSISKQKKENFPNHFSFKNWVISTDNGWESKKINDKTVVFKGYSDSDLLENILEKIILSHSATFMGNFCCFVIDEEKITIKTDTHRSFPIFYNDEEITNLKILENKIYPNEIIEIQRNLNVKKYKFKNFKNLTLKELSEDEDINKIDEILNKKFLNFFKFNNLPVKIFLSGGLDSLLIYSYALKFTKVEIILQEYFEFDYFYLKNHNDIKKFWAYNQMLHYKNPTLFLVGTPGDEFMLRGPETVNLYCKTNNLDILKLLKTEEYKNCYHKLYFNNEKNKKIFFQPISKLNKSKEYCYASICNILLNDFQHFHLGNTLTYTPLRDIEITKLMLNLPLSVAIKQIMDGYITKKIIEKNNPELLKYLSKFKNSNNCMENLTNLIM